jgi:drug/metabolite transporter (DMT)-like permease
MDKRGRGLLQIHAAVLLFGLTGIFGKSIDLPARYITLGRVFFASVSMGLFFLVKKTDIRPKCRKDCAAMILTGALLAFHWSAFYASVQLSTVAIALLTFSAYPIFVTFIEPVMFSEKLKKADVAAAMIMFLGVLLIVPAFDIKNDMTAGLLWGIAGSAAFAAMSLVNRKFAKDYGGSIIAFYEQGSAALFLLPMLIFCRPAVSARDMGLLALLGILFTGVAHSLFIGGMKYVRAQTAGIIAGIESVYGIIFAALILNEIPTVRELTGGAVILGTALYTTMRSKSE